MSTPSGTPNLTIKDSTPNPEQINPSNEKTKENTNTKNNSDSFDKLVSLQKLIQKEEGLKELCN